MKRRNFLYISAITGFGLSAANPLKIFSANEAKSTGFKFDDIIRLSSKENWKDLPVGLIIGKIGEQFLDTPYVGGTLEDGDTEKCIVRFDALDCVTFFETSLCLARNIKRNKLTKKDLIDEVTFTRYRGGRLNGYESRLHYTSDWILDNVSKGVVADITKDLKGIKFPLNLSFMSSNPKYYKQLKSNPALVKKISKIESDLNKKEIFYIPKSKIASIQNEIKTGDIIAITTNKKGIDYSHTGIAYHSSELKTSICSFMHASSKKKKVTVESKLVDYLDSVEADTGITVLRPIDL